MSNRALFGAAAAAFLAACSSDPVAPPKPIVSDKIPQVINAGVNLTTYDTAGGIPTQPGVVNSQTAALECWNRVNAASTPQFTSSQQQTLKFNDITGRVNSGVVGYAKLKIVFKGYLGTYAGQPLKCTSLKLVTMTRQLNNGSNTAQRKTEFNFIPLDGWNWCWGNGCTATSAAVNVQALVMWKWAINLDCFICSTYSQNVVLGGTSYYGDIYPNRWEVATYPSGYWTAFDYGGNGGTPYGYWQWGPTGYELGAKYLFADPQITYANRGGPTHWELTNVGN